MKFLANTSLAWHLLTACNAAMPLKPKWLPLGPKTYYFFGRSDQVLQNKCMRKVDDGGEKTVGGIIMSETVATNVIARRTPKR